MTSYLLEYYMWAILGLLGFCVLLDSYTVILAYKVLAAFAVGASLSWYLTRGHIILKLLSSEEKKSRHE